MPSYLHNLFGKSPVGPLQSHIAKAHECVSELIVFFEAVIAKDEEGMKKAQKRITELEDEADKIKKELRMQLPSSMFLPVSRGDLLDLITLQDDLADKAKDIAGLMLGRKMSLPDGLGDKFLEYVKRSVDASEQAKKTIDEFDELVETGFRGGEVKFVSKLIKTLNSIENDTDKLQVKLRSKLFALEKDLPPVDVMFTYQIIQWVGELADVAQRIGSRLQIMLAK